MIESLVELKQVLTDNERVVLKVSTPTCGPCKQIKPVYERIAETVDYPLIEVEISGNSESDLLIYVKRELSITAVPAFRVFLNGEVVNSFGGVLPEEKLIEQFETNGE